MNYRMICRVLGYVLLIISALMLLPLIAGLWYRENVLNFVITIGCTAALGFLMSRVKPASQDMFAREGFAIVGISWLLMSLLGALPFVISGDIPSYIDAVFETASGFTTTGASILNDVEGLSRGCMFWRCFTHWIGGMGMLVFLMAIMPMSGEHSMHIMRAEVPGPTVGKLVPRVRKTATILYMIYFALTVLEAILLLCGGMSFYDAILHAFATAGTGGFSTRAASIGAFNSTYIDVVITVFMILFGVNFNLYYLMLIGKFKDALKSEELHVYLAIIVSAAVIIAICIADMYGGFTKALRYSFFNVATVVSTTGFGNADFTKWPALAQVLLVAIMFMGGCAGSTGGGMKVSRLMVVVKSAFADISQMISPRSVNVVRLDKKRVSSETVKACGTYFAIYMLILLVTTVLISADGYDTSTNFTAAISCLSNIGPGLSLVGPAGNFAIFSDFSKIVMTLAMLLGRLEVYPLLVLVMPAMWRKK